MESVECLVVGAGVIGLAVARALASGRAGSDRRRKRERDRRRGQFAQQRSHPCRHLLSDRARQDAALRRRQSDAVRILPRVRRSAQAMRQAPGGGGRGEVDKLAALKAQAKANGVVDLIWLSGEEARALEPALVAERALLSPSTGIIDSHAFMLALSGDAEAHGATIAFGTPVLAGRAVERGLVIETGGPAPMRIAAGVVVNAAGLGAQALARSIAGHAGRQDPAIASRQGQLLFLERALSLLTPHLSDADARRPRRASHPRSRRTGQIRTGRRMDRHDQL